MPPRCAAAAAAALGAAVAFGGAAGAIPDAPLAYSQAGSSGSPAPVWVLDESLSSITDGMETGTLDDAKWAKSFAGWPGEPPAVVSEDNVATAIDKRGTPVLQLKLKEAPSGYDFDSAMQTVFSASLNTSTPHVPGETCTCANPYEGYTSGLIHSMGSFRFGYLEVSIRVPNAAVVGNIWLQGASTEISIAKIVGSDPTRSVESRAHVFDAEATKTNGHSATAGVINPGEFNVIGLEWTLQHDLIVHVNGALANTIAGASWNPDGISEGVRLVVDVGLDVEGFGLPVKADEDTPVEHTVSVKYVAAWKLDCGRVAHTVMTVNNAKLGVRAFPQASAECEQGRYGEHCIRKVLNGAGTPTSGASTCVQHEHEGTGPSLTNPGDQFCSLMTDYRFCGAWKDNTGKICAWDPYTRKCATANMCGPEGPVIQKGKYCGGQLDNEVGGSHGKCMFCFGVCRSANSLGICNPLCTQILGDNEKKCKNDWTAKIACRWNSQGNKCAPKNLQCWTQNKKEAGCQILAKTGKCLWTAADQRCTKNPDWKWDSPGTLGGN